MKSFGEILRTLRLEKGLTQDEVASHFGLHKTRISQYELNKRQADDDMKKRLAKFFNVSLDYLMGNTDIRESANEILNGKEPTIALHSDYEYDELPEQAKEEINNFIEFVKQKYKNK